MSSEPNRPSAEILRASFELQNIEAAAKKKQAAKGGDKDGLEDKAAAIEINAHRLSQKSSASSLARVLKMV